MTARAISDADLLAFVRLHGDVDAPALRKAFGVPQSTALRTLDALCARGMLERAGTREVQYMTTVSSNLYRVLPAPVKRTKAAGPFDGLLT